MLNNAKIYKSSAYYIRYALMNDWVSKAVVLPGQSSFYSPFRV